LHKLSGCHGAHRQLPAAIHTDREPGSDGELGIDGRGQKDPAGICAILVGGFGVHKFIMGYTTEGIIQLVLGLCGIGWILGLIEGIIYLTKSDEDFVRTYFQNRRGWF
jgi:hypothetical protein